MRIHRTSSSTTYEMANPPKGVNQQDEHQAQHTIIIIYHLVALSPACVSKSCDTGLLLSETRTQYSYTRSVLKTLSSTGSPVELHQIN